MNNHTVNLSKIYVYAFLVASAFCYIKYSPSVLHNVGASSYTYNRIMLKITIDLAMVRGNKQNDVSGKCLHFWYCNEPSANISLYMCLLGSQFSLS